MGPGCGTQPVANQKPRDRIKQHDDVHRKESQCETAHAEPAKSEALPHAGVMSIGECAFARLAEKDHAEELDHRVATEGGGQRNAGGKHRDQHVDERTGQADGEEETLQQQPFRDEAIEWRQSGGRERADQRETADPRHGSHQATQAAEIALAGRMQHGTCADEEKALEEGMIEALVEHRRQRQRGKHWHRVGAEQDGDTNADEHEPQIFDRGVREQAFHVGLHGTEDDAVQGRQQANAQSH